MPVWKAWKPGAASLHVRCIRAFASGSNLGLVCIVCVPVWVWVWVWVWVGVCLCGYGCGCEYGWVWVWVGMGVGVSMGGCGCVWVWVWVGIEGNDKMHICTHRRILCWALVFKELCFVDCRKYRWGSSDGTSVGLARTIYIIHEVYLRRFWQGNHQIYSHIWWCIYMVPAKPTLVPLVKMIMYSFYVTFYL